MYLLINKWVTAVKVSKFSGHYLRNRSTLDIGVLGYIGIVWPKEHSPEVSHIPPVTPCIYIYILKYSAGSGRIKWHLNISWSHNSIGFKSTYVIHLIRVPYFVYTLRLMFSCNLWMLISGSVMGADVLLYKAVSEYLVAVAEATAVTTLDV